MDTLGLMRRTRADFAHRWHLVFAWQLVVQMIGASVVMPLAGWLLGHVVARSGSAVVSNFDLARFVLSPWGAIFVLIALTGSIAFHMAQFAGYTWIAGHAIGRRPSNLVSTLGAVWARLGLLTAVGARMFASVLLLALPFLAVAAVLWFATLRGHDVNYWLAERPPPWRRFVDVSQALGAVYAFLALRQFARWIFTMPLAMFDRAASARTVLQASERLLAGVLLRSIAPLVAWWLALGAASTAVFWLAGRVSAAALDWAGTDFGRVLPLVSVFLAAGFVLAFVYSTLQFAGHQFLITRIYAEHHADALALDGATEQAAARVGRRRSRPVVLGLFVVMALAAAIGGALVSRHNVDATVEVTAHRGASRQAPENTMAAVRAAHAAGATHVEIDVQRTRDGSIVVLHDADLMRMAGDPRRLRDLTLDELARIDVGAHSDPRYAGERVPTLAEVIDFARGRLRLNVELKYPAPDEQLAPAVVDLLLRERFTDQAVVTSLDQAALRQVERIAPSVRTGLIVTASVGNLTATEADFVSLNVARAEAALVRRLHSAGKQVHVWTVNDPKAMLAMIERNVDNVITDDPATLVRIMRRRDALPTGAQLALALRTLFADPPAELTDERAVRPL